MQRALPIHGLTEVGAPTRGCWAALAALSIVALGMVATKVRTVSFSEGPMLLPCMTVAGLVAMLVCCAILRNQYRATGFAPFAFLATAYGVCAALIVSYLFTFPRMFSPDGFGLGTQVAMWLWVAWHAAFILLVGLYVYADLYFTRRAEAALRADRIVERYSLGVTILTPLCMAALFFFHVHLPALAAKNGATTPFEGNVERALIYAAAAVFAALVVSSHLRKVLHLWMATVLIAFIMEVALSGGVLQGSYSLALAIGRGQALLWQSLLLLIQLQDWSEQLAAFVNDNRELAEENVRDALTALYNRGGFDLRFEEAVRQSRRAHTPLALLLMDLDHFKAYNDYFGHLAGDEALRLVARAIAGAANRSTDACCRVGGEEFAIVLRMTDEPSARTVAERVRASVMQLTIPHAPGVSLPYVTVSIGIAATDGRISIPPKGLYQLADKALYQAKRLGRNRIALATQSAEAHAPS